MNNRIITLLMSFTIASVVAIFGLNANANNILSYSTISKTSSSTDVGLKTLETHLQWFKDRHIKVVSLDESLKEVYANQSSNTVSLVFEGGNNTFYSDVEPLLKRYNYPALLLINPFNVESKDHITADNLNKLATEKNITIGIVPNHRFFYKYKTRLAIKKNLREYREKLNSLLFYPKKDNIYMSISTPFPDMDSVLESLQITPIGKTQGVLSKYNTLLNRRFVIRSNISLARLKLNSTVRPIPIVDVLPISSYISKRSDNPPEYGFTVTGKLALKASKVSCFSPNSADLIKHVMDGGRVELRFAKKLRIKYPVRVYCSLRSGGQMYSYTRTFFVAK